MLKIIKSRYQNMGYSGALAIALKENSYVVIMSCHLLVIVGMYIANYLREGSVILGNDRSSLAVVTLVTAHALLNCFMIESMKFINRKQ
ncbi:hypothetical protein HDU91_005486 [Kappamyces sp. JEL0680]|nr:hypothetical protein HDU91_005486 [Kappamyces sp. JEL0680]